MPYPGKMKPLQSETFTNSVAFSDLQLFGNEYNINCFFDPCWQYCLQLLHHPRKLGWYLQLEQYFPVQIQNTVLWYYYKTYSKVAKAFLNNLRRKAAKMKQKENS